MTRQELQAILDSERKLYLGANPNMLLFRLFPNRRYQIWRCLDAFRRMQYWHGVKDSENASFAERLLAKIRFYINNRRYCKYSWICGVELDVNSHIGCMCNIWHSGVVINGDVGDNCVFHGYNTIGNKGCGRSAERPVLGDRVDVGVGAVVIGNVRVADGCKIGANAAVVKSVEKENSILVGVPAHCLE